MDNSGKSVVYGEKNYDLVNMMDLKEIATLKVAELKERLEVWKMPFLSFCILAGSRFTN